MGGILAGGYAWLSPVTSANAENKKLYQLKKELEQCKRDLINFAFPKTNSTNLTNASIYPLKEVSMLSADTES